MTQLAPTTIVQDIWRWSTQTALPPNNGQIRSDTADWASATHLSIACRTDAGVDLGDDLVELAAGDDLRLEQKTDSTRYAHYQATADSIDYGTYFSVPVSYLDGAGNLPNSSTQIVFTATTTSAPASGVARWTMEQDDTTHWVSVVTCPHGRTQNGVWTVQPVQDDRNLEPFGQSTYANHLATTGCDCTFEAGWSPSYVPSPPAPLPKQSASEPEVVASHSSGTATYQITQMLPMWSAMSVNCPHGSTLQGMWFNESSPPATARDTPPAALAALVNHTNLTSCTCVFQTAPAQVTATVVLKSVVGVAADITVAISQSASTVPAPLLMDSFGRLSMGVAGSATITATFSLMQSVAQGGGGIAALRFPPAATPDLTAPSVATAGFSDQNGQATTSFVWSGSFAANTSIELNYYNGSGKYQDVQGGSLTVTFTPS